MGALAFHSAPNALWNKTHGNDAAAAEDSEQKQVVVVVVETEVVTERVRMIMDGISVVNIVMRICDTMLQTAEPAHLDSLNPDRQTIQVHISNTYSQKSKEALRFSHLNLPLLYHRSTRGYCTTCVVGDGVATSLRHIN
ncbi:hypothetical protein E2C01_033326 [Portunus trituberculatus]|uniref:Uncharacterized protein n=1 Tax=Portunus trituberculatus TaxID=210409 RepID=A0A5B7F2N9_PORTR|nr:hypothetical protein [Portunus trituberculatus]